MLPSTCTFLLSTVALLLVRTSVSFLLPTNVDRLLHHRPYHITSNKMTTSQKQEIGEETLIALIGVTCDSEKDASPVLREGVTDLFKLYFNELFELGCDLGFQGFQNEWIDLPGKYDFAKRGGLFIAVELPSTTGAGSSNENEEVFIVQPGMDLPDSSGSGKLLDALKDKNQIVGCIAIRSLTEACGEVKRMYVRKTHRRRSIGKLLAKHIIDHAWNECNYEEIKLDSLERLSGAVTLYENLGFNRIEPYCECPEHDHVCMSMFRSDNK